MEDAPALDPIAKFPVHERDGAVYIEGDEATIKSSRRTLDVSCASVQASEKVVILGGGSGATAAVEALRGNGFKGEITVVYEEGTPLYDRMYSAFPQSLASVPISSVRAKAQELT